VRFLVIEDFLGLVQHFVADAVLVPDAVSDRALGLDRGAAPAATHCRSGG